VTYVSGAANPLPTCVPKAYYISNGGTFYWTDCNGIDRRDVFETEDEICICSSNNLPTSQNGGTGYLLGGGCDCVTPTPTVYTIDLTYSFTDCSTACDNYYTTNSVTYYSLTNSFAVDTFLYTDEACTQPVSAGYYSQGANCLTINSVGKITATGNCPQYYYYDMSPCNGTGSATGRSSTDLSTISDATVAVSLYTCYLVHPDTGTYSYHKDYTYNLDGVTFLPNCSDSNCVAPPIYSQWLLTYNNGDFASSACSGNSGNRQPALYYTEAGTPLNNGSVLYSSPNLGQSTASQGYYSNGSFNWEIVSDGILTNQTPC
jgi:hypothetical protein